MGFAHRSGGGLGAEPPFRWRCHMSNCIFCSIVEGRLPAFIIYEDGIFLAILDRYPGTRGEILILPKRHVEDIYGLNQEETAALMPLAKRVSEKMRNALEMDGLNLIQNNGKAAGQEINHFHLHLLPRYANDSVKLHKKPTNPPLDELEQVAGLLKL